MGTEVALDRIIARHSFLTSVIQTFYSNFFICMQEPTECNPDPVMDLHAFGRVASSPVDPNADSQTQPGFIK